MFHTLACVITSISVSLGGECPVETDTWNSSGAMYTGSVGEHREGAVVVTVHLALVMT